MSWQPEDLELELQAIATAVLSLAQKCQGDNLALLALLRQLEQLHREIRDGMFQDSLPDNRQALYALLRDIETTGGWPYIERMKLQNFLAFVQPETLLEIDRPILEAEGAGEAGAEGAEGQRGKGAEEL